MGKITTSPRSFAQAVFAAIAGMVIVPILIVACASSPAGPQSTSYIVSAVSTPFFKYGPAQAFGADLNLSQGQRLTMLTRSFGFSRVMLENGMSGYVSTDDIKPVAPTPVPKPTPGPNTGGGWFSRRKPAPAGNFNSSPNPLFDVSDVPPPPLPTNASTPSPEKPKAPAFRYDSDKPKATPSPSFRY